MLADTVIEYWPTTDACFGAEITSLQIVIHAIQSIN